MAKIKLDVESNALSVFDETSRGLNELSTEAEDFKKTGTDSFKSVSKEADEFTKSIVDSANASIRTSKEVTNARIAQSEEIEFVKQQIKEITQLEKEQQKIATRAAPGLVRQAQLKKLQEIRFDLKEMKGDLVQLEVEEKRLSPPIITLRKQVRDLKEEMGREHDPLRFNELAEQAGELQAEIDTANKATKAFSKETKASTAITLFKQIGHDISELDFPAAAAKAKQLKSVVQTFTFKEMIKGGKAAIATTAQLTIAMLSLPIVWLALGIAAIVVGYQKLAHSAEESVKEQIKSLDRLGKRYEDMFNNRLKLAQITGEKTDQIELNRLKAQRAIVDRELDLLREKSATFFGLSDEEEAKYEELKQTQLDIDNEITIAKTKALFDRLKEEEEAAEKAKKLREKQAKEDLKLAKDLANALIALAKKASSAELAGLRGEEKLRRQKEIADQEVEIIRQSLIEKQVLAGKGAKLSLEVQEQFDILTTRNAEILSEGLISIAVNNANELEKIEQSKTDSAIESFERRQQTLIDAANSVEQPDGVGNEQFELQKQRAVLEIQKKGLTEQFALNVESIRTNNQLQATATEGEILLLQNKTDKISNTKRLALELDLARIKASTPEELEALEAKYDAQLALLNKSIKDNKEAAPKRPVIDWASILGVTDEQAAALIQGVNAALAQVQQLVDENFKNQQRQLDKELDVIEQRKRARENEIDDLEDRLKEEERLQGLGLANDVDKINNLIAAKKAGAEQEVLAQKKLQQQKKELALEQIKIDTALQASQLITAVATTINTYAAVPYVAAALVALQIGTFVAAKAQAFNSIQNQDANNFKDGVIDLQGPGTSTSDSIPSNLSKGESVFTASETKDNINLFNGIRKGDHRLIEIGVGDLLANTGVVLSEDTPKDLSNIKSNIKNNELSLTIPRVDNTQNSRIDLIQKDVAKLVAIGGDKTYTDSKGNSVIESGNYKKTIIKKDE